MTAPSVTTDALLAVDDVYAAYGKKQILNGVSLEVRAGEIVALLGGNGAGKSTVLRVVSGLMRAAEGRIYVAGQNVTAEGSELRHRLGIVFMLQGGRVFPNLSVEENLAVALRHRRADIVEPEVTIAGSHFPQMEGLAHRRAGLLSGGERQMLAAEMVLAQQPAIALLDEPTGALAPDLRMVILTRIKKYAKVRRAAVLLVEQNVDDAKRVADRCLVLERGLVRNETEVPDHAN